MPVNTVHEQYQQYAEQWERIRDVLAGEDAVKRAGTRYLPRPQGWTEIEYDAYKQRGLFHEATGRTLDGLTGAIFRKDIGGEQPEAFANSLMQNVTGRGTPLQQFAKLVTRETIGLGRYGVLVDVPQEGGEPYQVGYVAENILNWRTSIIGGVPVLSLVVLKEMLSRPKADDPFDTETVERYRVLSLGPIEDGGANVYQQAVFEKQTGTREGFAIVDGPRAPTRRGERLSFIPFQFVGPMDLSPEVQRSPILGLVNANLSHYRTSTQLEHGAFWTALPTPYVAGGLQDDNGGPLRIGSTTAWLLAEGAEAGMLEFTGAGLEALEKRLERKEQHMAVLGARLLEDQKREAEAAETVALRHRGENSVLASIADTVGRGLTNTTNWQWWWAGGGEDDITVKLNDDFVERAMTPQEMVQLVGAWQQGGIGGEALYHNLREGERIPPDWTLEDWQRDLEENGPQAAFLGDMGDPDA